MTKPKKPKIVLAPMNIASMPIQVVNALKKNGYTAEQASYTIGEGHKFGYEMDREFNVKEHGGRIKTHALALREYLDRDFDIYHFWNKSLFFEGQYGHLTGFDIPLIKARGKRIAYRFTGYDLRLPSWDKAVNPHSPFHHGYAHIFDEELQKKYLGFLEEYVDQFLVQDPEMAQFAPKGTKIIPRAMDLEKWDMVGVEKNDVPLVVHAPSNKAVKGTAFIMKAVAELQEEGLKFRFKPITGMQHSEAKKWYAKSDIIIDQIMIGATGVLTLEAWALGKPCVVYLREDLFKDFYKCSELPVANANPDTIKDQLRKLIKDYEWRQDLSKRGRKTVKRFHDSDKVVKKFIRTYEGMMKKKPVTPKGTRDVDYLQAQAQASQRLSVLNNVKTRQVAQLKVDLKNAKVVDTADLAQRMTGAEKVDLIGKILPPVIAKPIGWLYALKKTVKPNKAKTVKDTG